MTNNEYMKKVEEQEKKLIFNSFDSDIAFTIGTELINEAKARNNKIAIDISAFGRCLFHFSSNGNAPSNDVMLERKKKTALHTGHSSLWAHYFLADVEMSIYEKWALSPSEYAQVGGSFPIRVKNCEGVIGTITVSGFAHTMDHGIIIDILERYLEISGVQIK